VSAPNMPEIRQAIEQARSLDGREETEEFLLQAPGLLARLVEILDLYVGHEPTCAEEEAYVRRQRRTEVLAEAAAAQLAFATEHWASTPTDSVSTAGKKDRKYGVAETLASLLGVTPVLRPRFIRVLPQDNGFLVRWQVGEESKAAFKATQAEADAVVAELWGLAAAGKDTGGQTPTGESTQPTGHVDWCPSHDSDGLAVGHYTTRAAAMDHIHHLLAAEENTTAEAIQTRVIWRADTPDGDAECAWECWMFDDDEDDAPTGYVVAPVTVATAYTPQRDTLDEGEVPRG
jgi:hypothetical protein